MDTQTLRNGSVNTLNQSYSEAEEALAAAKIHMMCKQGSMFFSSVSVLLTHRISTDVPTAATNGKEVIYNPEFFLSISKEERVGLIAHEVGHVAYLHSYRVGDRDRKIWNYAGDYVINGLLINSGFKLPAEGCYDPQYSGMSTEQVYDLLIQEAIQPPPEYVGDLLEASGEPNETLEQEVSNIVIQAIARTQMDGGKVPKEIAISIEELVYPKLDWKEVLKRFVDNNSKDDFTWTRPNKKYFPEYYLPSRYSEQINNITIAIDTSGSMTKKFIQEIMSEVQFINDTVKPNDMTIMDCDIQIHNIYHLSEVEDILNLKFTGRGGTSVFPVLEYCKEHETNLLVYFTDGYFTHPEEEPGYPILWIISGDNRDVIPIGETVYAS